MDTMEGEIEERIAEVTGVLNSTPNMEVVLSIIGGDNYASAIAKRLGHSVPTVAEQLKELEEAGVVEVSDRGKAKKYKVDWKVLTGSFHHVIDVVCNMRGKFAKEQDKEVKEMDKSEIIPRELIKAFLTEYVGTRDALGGKRKDLGELVLSFFSAMNDLSKSDLDKNYWERLIDRFDLNEEYLKSLNWMVGREHWLVEQTAVTGYLELQGGD